MTITIALFAPCAVHVNLNFAAFCESLHNIDQDLYSLPITAFLPRSLSYLHQASLA